MPGFRFHSPLDSAAGGRDECDDRRRQQLRTTRSFFLLPRCLPPPPPPRLHPPASDSFNHAPLPLLLLLLANPLKVQTRNTPTKLVTLRMAEDKEVFAAQLSESLDMESGSSEENKLVEMRVHNGVAAEDNVGYNSLSQPPPLPPPVTSSDLSKEQLAEIQDIFSRFDRDQDGSITELELGSLLRSLGLKPNGSQLEALVQRADTNANGYIDFDEFVALIGPEMVTTAVPYNQGELLAVFRTFDRDGNGFITAAELAHSMAKLGHALSVKELSDMIREADTDGDGRISFTEFAAAMSSAASVLDVSL